MNKSKQNIALALAGVLALGNVGLFIYDNIYMEKKEGNETVIIYAAKEEIKPNTVITEDLFMEVKIPKKGLLPTYVTDLSGAIGKSVSGSLKEYDILTNARLENKGYESQGTSYISLTPDVKAQQVSKNDTVNVYIREKRPKSDDILVENMNNSMQKLFDNKTIIDVNADSTSFTILGTEEEVKTYYAAKIRGDIIIVPVTEGYTENKSSNKDSYTIEENNVDNVDNDEQQVQVQETNLDTSNEN